MLIAKRSSVALRFFGNSRPRPGYSHLTFIAGLLPTHASAGNFIPTTAANLLTQTSMSDQAATSGLLLRRRNKVFGFVIAEASAIGLLFLTGAIAVSLKPSDPTLAFSINLLTIAAAAAVAIIPILYFAIAPVLPRADH